MRVAAIIFGVSRYADVSFNSGVNALRYAANDARSFERYFRAAWSNASQLTIECWTDLDATSARWSSSIDRLADTNPDVFVAYVAGHASRDGNTKAAFCLADANGVSVEQLYGSASVEPRHGDPNRRQKTADFAVSGAMSGNVKPFPGHTTNDGAGTLGAQDFDRAFRHVAARTSVLFLDCCYAEAVVAETEFFHALEDGAVRLFLCSSRATQKTWEDATLRHGLFSTAVISGLADISPLAGADGYVDIERLFGSVCDEVPKRAFASKGRERQEPVRGGLSSSRMRLPTASVGVLGGQISTYDVVATAFRRWLTRAALLLFGVIAISDLTFQHLAVDTEGNVVARSGLPVFEPLRRILSGGIIDTGFDRDDLRIEDSASGGVISALENRQLVGSRLWSSTAWPAKLRPLLNTRKRQSLSVLLHGTVDRDADTYDPDLDGPPLGEIVALQALAPSSDWAGNMDVLSYPVPDVDLDCGTDVRNVVDFTHLNPTTDRFVREMDWRLTTATTREEQFRSFEDAARLVGYRYERERRDGTRQLEYDSVREFERLADWALSERYRGATGLGTELGDSWCSLVDAFVVALAADDERALRAEDTLSMRVETYDREVTGDLVIGNAEIGLELLAIVAEHGSLEETTIDRVSYFVRSDARGLAGTPQFVEWLARVAAWTVFPEDTREFLFETLAAAREDDDFGRIAAFNILARNAGYLDEIGRGVVARWAEENRNDFGTQDLYVDGVAYLASVLPEEFLRDYLSTVRARTEPGRAMAPRAESWRGDIIITVTDVPEWRAIARVAQGRPVAGDVVAQLLSFAAVAAPDGGREEALRAVAYQREDIRSRDWEGFRRALARKIRGGFRFRYRHKSPRVVQVPC